MAASFRIFSESLRLAMLSLRSSKLRTSLTILGIVVGVTAVIAVMTIISGLDSVVAGTFSSQGSTVFTVSKRPMMVRSREEAIKYNYRRDITKQDAAAIERSCRLCHLIGFSDNHTANVKFADKTSEQVLTRGMTATMFVIENVQMSVGRPWSGSEEAIGASETVIGPDLADNLFPNTSPDDILGESIRVDGQAFRIIGIAASRGKVLGFSRDNFIYMPYVASQRMYGSRGSLGISVRVADATDFESAQDEVRAIIRNRRAIPQDEADDGFSIESQDAFVDLYRQATSGIYLATVGMAAISLIVGGIVVMNIMLVTVTERAHEIGLRKSVGARQKDILTQFVVEAVAVTGTGGAIGVVAGYGTAALLAYTLGFPINVDLTSAILGVSVSVCVGLASGVYPAWKAAHLNPIEAMRKER